MYEFQAKTLDGQTAMELASDDGTRESLLKLEQRLYQDMLNGAIKNGQLPAGIADFAQLENLVAEHGLDVHEAAMLDENDVYSTRDGMTVALESGNAVQVQFLARLLDLRDLTTWRNKDGQGMIHVAAGRSASWHATVRDTDMSLREREQPLTRHSDQQHDKLLFMQYHWNHASAAFYSEGRKHVDSSPMSDVPDFFRLILQEYETHCQESANTAGRIQLLQWLIQEHGLSLPEYRFIIHNCNFPIAKFLLEYRLKTDRFINEQFQDNAPLAMVGVKQFLYSITNDACLTASDVALLCVQRPAYDELLCITDACRLLLLDWLYSNGYVDLVTTRSTLCDSILHEAVCYKETVIAVWLARRFPVLAHTRSATTGQLPVHVALERVADQDDCVEKAVCKFMILYAGEGRSSVSWSMDMRAWALEDSNGRTVKDYAMSCSVDEVQKEALKAGHRKAYHRMLDMALDEACSTTSFQSHAERTKLKGFRFDDWDEMRFIHSSISLGRLDVLQ
jgi:hypothetical protein